MLKNAIIPHANRDVDLSKPLSLDPAQDFREMANLKYMLLLGMLEELNQKYPPEPGQQHTYFLCYLPVTQPKTIKLSLMRFASEPEGLSWLLEDRLVQSFHILTEMELKILGQKEPA